MASNLYVESAHCLFNPSEIDKRMAQAAVLTSNDLALMAETLDWVRNFLGKPHPDLGRPGPVCPFVPTALSLNTLWMKVVRIEDPSVAQMEKIVEPYREVFLKLEPTDAKNSIYKTIMLLFPDVPLQEAPVLIDGVKQKLKSSFVDDGLMLGEFHKLNTSGGLHNPNFRPLQSPIPMLAIRFMVSTDLPFLMKSTDHAAERARFLEAYLSRFDPLGDDPSPRMEMARRAFIQAVSEASLGKEAGMMDSTQMM